MSLQQHIPHHNQGNTSQGIYLVLQPEDISAIIFGVMAAIPDNELFRAAVDTSLVAIIALI